MSEAELQLDRLFQVNMPVKDIERAVSFYRDVLRLPLHGRRGPLAFMSVGTVRLLLEVLDEPEGGRYHHPGSVLYFEVPEIERAHRELVARGVEFISGPESVARNEREETWMAFFSDGEWNTHAIVGRVPVAATSQAG